MAKAAADFCVCDFRSRLSHTERRKEKEREKEREREAGRESPRELE